MSNTHEWCAEGITPEIDNLQEVPTVMFPDWVEKHCSGRAVHIPSVAGLARASNLRNVLEPQGIRSLITLPLMHRETCLGFVGFDAVREERCWSEEEVALLRILAELFANFEIRRRTENELAQANDERALLLDTMDAQVWYLTDMETYGAVNQAHADFLGLPKARIEYKRLDEFLPFAEAVKCRASNRQVYAESRMVKTQEWIANAAGIQRLLAITKTPKISAEKSAIDYVVCVGHDITELHQMQQRLTVAKEEAEAAARAKAMFLANMSHEIRTPLNAILGYCQIMERECQDCERKGHALTTIMRSGEHLLSMIEDILTIVRVDAGNLPLNESEFDLRQLLQDARRMVAERRGAGTVSISTECSPRVPVRVYADRGKIVQVLLNLLSNAVKFTAEGGICIAADVVGGAADGGTAPVLIEVSVIDSGCGIDADGLDQIFEAFEQTEQGHETGKGSGLGLALCRHYARALGGNVLAESHLGEGSTFRFTFKARPVQPDDGKPAREKEAKGIDGLVPDVTPPRLLVVDDDAPNRVMLANMLEAAGFRVENVDSGSAAIEALRGDGPFDMLLLDKRMPGMDGVATLNKIRRHKIADNTKILIITASGFEDDGKEVMSLGADGFMLKPFRRDELLETIKSALGISYVYAKAPDDAAGQPTAETGMDVGDLPSAAIEALRVAVRRGDIRTLQKVVNELASQNRAAAEILRPMVNRYDYDGITALLSQKE